MADSAAPAGDRRTRLVLAVCCLAQFTVILDLSIVNVALPTIQSALEIAASDLQWVIDAYAILFAGFLMLAGRATDVLGHRRLFAGSLLGFALASLVGGLAPSPGVLIAGRALQGLAGAGMAASSLAILTATFAPGPARHKAIALWGSMNGVGGAAGVLAGGVLTDLLSWRWVLLVNVPICVGGAALALAVVADRRAPDRPGLDPVGALVLTAGLLIATYGGVTAGAEGFGSADALVPMAVGSALLALFPVVERRVRAPLVPPGALTGQLRSINLIVLLFSSALFAMWYSSSLYLQQVLSLSPLEAGLVFLPMALAIFAAARPAGRLTTRAGVRPVLGGGLTMLALGLALLSRVGDGGSPLQYILLPGLLVAVGIGFSVVSSTIAATQSAAPERAGLSSALVNTARQVGGGLGLAVLISIATQRTSSLIGSGDEVNGALADGFGLAYLVSACVVAVAAVLAFVLLPRAAEAPQRATGRRILVGVGIVAVAFVAVGFGLPRSRATPIGAYTLDGARTFASAPGLHPPQMQLLLDRKSARPLPGLIMAANFLDLTKGPIVGQSGPLMLDDQLEPVWFKPLPTDLVAANLDTHVLDGKPVLSYWQGDVSPTGEVNSGQVVFVDQQYRQIAKLEGHDGWVISLHDVAIRDGLVWVTANRNESTDLSKVGGVSTGVLVDSALQAYDLRSGKLVRTWRATDHIPMADSETQPPPNGFPWDAYHINSLQLTDDGRALVSMRNTSAAYLFDLDTGRIEWQLGGARSSFALPADARFAWQHDVELRDEDTVSLFDNHCCEITGAGEYLPSDRGSRGLVLRLDRARRTARVLEEDSHGETFRSQYMGNVQRLADGSTFVGWGQVPFLTEYDPSGKMVFDGAFPSPNLSYRTRVRSWVGKPATPPSGALRRSGDGMVAYASWNGATEVARWRVLAGTGTRRLAERARDGFETEVPVPGGTTSVRVQALDARGRVLGTSARVAAGS